jgi:hypothetical protein
LALLVTNSSAIKSHGAPQFLPIRDHLRVAANRDPAVCDDPDRLDIRRRDAQPIQTFGSGAHYCLGANLARLELAEALAVMTRRIPNPRRTGPAPCKPVSALAGPVTLPIEFDPTAKSLTASKISDADRCVTDSSK